MINQFITELNKFRRKWQIWQLRCRLLSCASWSVLIVAVLCWVDLIFSLTTTERIVLNSGSLIILLIWFGIHAIRIFKISESDSAIHADTLLKSRRREILSALEMGRRKPHGSLVSQYLVAEVVASALEQLNTIENVRPLEHIRKLRKRLALCLAVALIPALFNPHAGRVLIGRLLFPYADIPPYSAFVFTISPENPEVIYGSDQIIQASITGKRVNHPVRFVTRQGGHILESPCFQAAPDKYLQQIDQVMQPMSFCFRVGKARSRWYDLKVLFQPQVQSAQIRLTPPQYTLKSTKEYTLGNEPLKGLKGTQVEMVVQSNRPLKAGHLTITPIDGISRTLTIEGKISAPNAITLNWEIHDNAHLSLIIYDILGTAARKPLQINQNLVPDMPPVVTLSEPMTFALATPTTDIPIYGFAEDDMGIRRVDLYRTLHGYRSRSVRVYTDPVGSENTSEIKKMLKLSELGVLPGQVIELFLEASDTNPALTGVGSSDITRIKIITEQEYAKMVRSRTTIAAFESRFSTLSEKFNELLKMLEQTAADLKNGKLPAEQSARQMSALQSKMKQTASDMQKIADDFSAFDLEKKLAQTAQKIANKIEYALGYEGWTSSDPSAQKEAISKSMTLLKNQTKPVRQLKKDLSQVTAVSRVMEMAAQYNALIDRQRIFVNRLEQYVANARKFPDPNVPAEQQEAIRKDLEKMIASLTQWANALPEEYESLKNTSLEFITTLHQLNIPKPMNASSKSCRDEQLREALRYAVQALEKMKQALNQSRGSAFGSMCNNGDLKFKIPDHLSQTLSEMMESLMQQYRSGSGRGDSQGTAGMGMGGTMEGSYLNGFSAFNLPVYGPESSLAPGMAAGRSGNGDGHANGSSVGQEARYTEVMPTASDMQQTEGDGFFMKNVPPKYQDAVKSFYSKELNH